MLEQFDFLFGILNFLNEGAAVNYISYYWDDAVNGWNANLIDEFAIRLIQSDIDKAYSNSIAFQY